jgi:hypothetical protein
MEKNYCLVVNSSPLFFKSLEGVRKWFIECGVKEVLESDEDEVIYELSNLEYLVGFGEINIVNDCMIERGDDYCSISLEEITFED